MLITTLFAKIGVSNIPIGKISTEKEYTLDMGRKLRNLLYREYPKMDYFKMVQEDIAPPVVPKGYTMLGEKGGRYALKVNGRTGKMYRQYITTIIVKKK